MWAAVPGVCLALFATAAAADVAPDPDELDAIVLGRVRAAGIDCAAIARLEHNRGDEADRLRRLGYSEQWVATCLGGPRVLVARGRRRGRTAATVTPFVQILDGPGAAAPKR